MKHFNLIILISIILLILTPKCNNQYNPVPKQIDKEILETIKPRIDSTKHIINEQSSNIEVMKDELDKVKQKRDTIGIIEKQDTIIEIQTLTLLSYKTLTLDMDTTIQIQKRVIVKTEKINRKLKRQRNIAIAGIIIITVIGLIK